MNADAFVASSRGDLSFVNRDRRIRARIDDAIDHRRHRRRSRALERSGELAGLLDAYAFATARACNLRVIDGLELTRVGVVAVHHVFGVPLVAEDLVVE